MRYTPLKYSCAVLFFILFTQVVFAQLSTKHFIPPLTSAEFGNANPENQYIYISTPNNLNVSYTITPIGQPINSRITGIVTNNNPEEIFIGTGNGQLFQPSNESSTVISDRGYIIEAEDVIYVSIRMRAGGGAQAGALVSKGIAGLGTQFRAGAYTNENPQSNYLNFFSMMATENNTNVTIDDLPAGLVIKNYSGSFPINITLNECESYIVATNSNENVINRDGLIGTLINSDKPIVVNSGSANGSFYNGNGRDYGIDQIVDFSNTGNEYVFVRGDGSDNFENILLVAHEDNTDIFINGGSIITTINAGEWYVIEGDAYNSNGNMYVNSSKNVFAYQGVGGNGNSEANQGMFFVPPLSCNNRGDLNSIANIQNIGNTVYNGGITIVTNRGSNVSINNLPIANFNTAGPFDVDGNSDYITYKVLGLTGNVSVLSTGELYCAYFNFNGVATSGSFYAGFPSPPEIDFNLDLTAAGNCIPNITLEAFNIDVFDSVEWHYDDGSGFIPLGEMNATYKPLLPGGYKLVGTISCSGLTYDSASVRVSVCPDDFDGDAVIDNLDIDIDNDGILNCDESLGNVSLDLLDYEQPVLNFQDGTTNTNFATGVIQTTTSSGNTTSITTQSNGDFTSEIGSAITAELSYQIDFNDAVNILFESPIGYSHTITDSETFSIIIGPSEQNITLLDPDNLLLIDTDFDGVFEPGITNFSTSEIRFRYNPTPNGTTPFKFVANKIDYVIFKHQLSNTLEASTFQGNLSLTCFALDSDGDLQEDAYDLDADNDGITDLLEASGQFISLTNTDTNFDGLDNVFNNVGVIPVDTDTDGILDYLDLDSDNDGIFDVFEANHTALDNNLDGIIDNAINLIGINGLVDLLETSPDSFILGYTPADSDNDNLLNSTELDSDNDECKDVIEAGFIDEDNDGLLGTSPITADNLGKVTSSNSGYTIPNIDYTIYAPIFLNSLFEDVEFCENSTTIIYIDSSADTFQWEVSTDGINWMDISNNINYSGVTTNTLQINNTPLSFDTNLYRVYLSRVGNACSTISNSVELRVNPLPILNNNIQLLKCDEDNDGYTSFNLMDANPLVSSNSTNQTFNYYPTLSDAQNNTNEILNPSIYTNLNINLDTIWIQVTSDNNCVSFVEIELIVSTVEIPSTFSRSYSECDDFLDIDGNNNSNNNNTDGITTFNFSSVTDDIITLFPANQQISISYYESELDAQLQQNEINNINSFRNINSPNNQLIYVRVENLENNSCLYIGNNISLNVNTIPISNPVNNLELCDDDSDGFMQGFNLESQTSIILGNQDPNNFIVNYYTSITDANLGVNQIINTDNYANTSSNSQTIYVSITNITTGCSDSDSSFNLIVNPLPFANNVNDLIACDDDNDGDSSNGIIQSFNLENQTNTILGNQNSTDYSVTYHVTELDAFMGNNEITNINSFSNTSPFSQTIYVRITNTITNCFSSKTSFD